MSGIKVTAPETVAALRYVLEKFSSCVSDTLVLARDILPWQEYDAVERHLLFIKEDLLEIITEITKP